MGHGPVVLSTNIVDFDCFKKSIVTLLSVNIDSRVYTVSIVSAKVNIPWA